MHNIFLSPGHWENEFETTNGKGIKINGEKIFEEFDFNIGVVEKLHKDLKKYKQFKIHQLEYNNNKKDMGLLERIKYINANYESDNDIVIAVHANYNNNSNIGGQWGFRFGENGKRFLDLYAKQCKNALIPYTQSFKCQKNTWSSFGIVLNTKPTSVLLEHGFFSNKRERAILRTKTYQNYCSDAILNTILEYYNIKSNEVIEKEKNIIVNEKEKIEIMKKIIKENTNYPQEWIDAFVEAIEIAKKQSNLGTFEVFKHLPDFVLKIRGVI